MDSFWLLSPILALFLIQISESSHHRVWEESYPFLAVEEAAKTAYNAPSTQHSRTAYHFQPSGHWMNGPLFYKGYYHLFYQYNPRAVVWGLIEWGHAVSTDMINWKHLAKPALVPDQWYDINGCWSGSATFLKDGIPRILYTGDANSSQQLQALAMPKDPSDPFLRHWIKAPQNPVMLPVGVNSSSFRDPTTAWLGSDHRWRVLVGNKRDKNKVGVALLYRSKDFISWERAKHPLHSAVHTGMWECPDFYPVSLNANHGLDTSVAGPSVKHVLKNSLDEYKVEYYTVGKYLPQVDRYVPDKGSVEGPNGLRYDYGKFYASKTFYDQNTGRRILWGWINESDSVADDMAKGWASVQAIPRVVWLDNGTRKSLIQWPISEVEALRGDHIRKDNVVLERGSVMKIEGLKSGAQVDVEIEFELGDNYNEFFEAVQDMNSMTAQSLCNNSITKGFGLMVLASDDLKERSVIFFGFFEDKLNRKYKRIALCVDQSRSTLHPNVDKTNYGGFVNVVPNQKSLSLRVLVDHSIVESFAEGGKTCITSRSYTTLAINDNAHIFAFYNGSYSSLSVRHLTAWDMNNALHVYA
eukprot:Gb_40450 [translate_table: standard]